MTLEVKYLFHKHTTEIVSNKIWIWFLTLPTLLVLLKQSSIQVNWEAFESKKLLATIHLDILANAIEPSLNQVSRHPKIIVGYDVDRANFGTLICCHSVFAEKLYAHIADDNSKTCC